jgi:hypothetical protein
MNKELYTIIEAAKSLGVTRQGVYKRLKKAKLSPQKIAGKSYIDAEIMRKLSPGETGSDTETGGQSEGTNFGDSGDLRMLVGVLQKQVDEFQKDKENLRHTIDSQQRQLEDRGKEVATLLEGQKELRVMMGGFQKSMGLLDMGASGNVPRSDIMNEKVVDHEKWSETSDGLGEVEKCKKADLAQKKTPQKRKKQEKGEKRKKEKVKKINKNIQSGCSKRGKETELPEPIVWLKRWFKKAA